MSENEAKEESNIEDFYIIGDTLGEGTFGKVKNGIHKLTNEIVFEK
jgi:hypothetical protein